MFPLSVRESEPGMCSAGFVVRHPTAGAWRGVSARRRGSTTGGVRRCAPP